MDDFTASAAKPNFRMKVWRGERMCLIAFDVDAPEPDLVGFAIECKPPGARRFSSLLSDKAGGLEIIKPDGSVGRVDFAYLAKNAPEPFKSEWSGGKGINVHHKFVVTDFNLPTAKVLTGSSNLAPSGENGNGDHLLMIEDPKIATAYAIEALRVFDHLHFRSTMQETTGMTAPAKRAALTLRKPRAISGKAGWFEAYYVVGSQKMKDRQLFAS